jgi:hypothetical protein
MSVRIHPDVVWVESGPQVRLYHSGTGEFQTLNATGSAIWLALAGGGPGDRLAAELADRFGAGDGAQRARIARDVAAFVDDLTGRGLLVAGDAR